MIVDNNRWAKLIDSGTFSDEWKVVENVIDEAIADIPTDDRLVPQGELENYSVAELLDDATWDFYRLWEREKATFDLLQRMLVRVSEIYGPIGEKPIMDLAALISVAHATGLRRGVIHATSVLGVVRTARDTPAAEAVRKRQRSATAARRKAGDRIRALAFDHCKAHPDTGQGECATKVSELSGKTTANVRVIILPAFHTVDGLRGKRLRPNWREILQG